MFTFNMAQRLATGSRPLHKSQRQHVREHQSRDQWLSCKHHLSFPSCSHQHRRHDFRRDRTFTTLAATGPPVVTTNAATNVTATSATLNGSLDPHGLTTTVFFQYGTTTNYGSATAMQSQTGNTYRNITANVSGLTPHTTTISGW